MRLPLPPPLPISHRTLVLYAGANALTAPASLSAPPPALAYTHLLLQNEVPWPATLSYLAHAAAIGATAVLNPSPLPSNAQLRALPWDRVAWLVVNAGEARGVLRALAADAAGALGAAGAAGASGAGDEEGEGKEEEEAERDDGEVSVDAARALLRALHASPAFARAVGVVCTLGAQGVLALLPPPPPPSPVSSSPSPVASLSAAADSTSSASFRAAAAAAEDPTESAAPEPKQEPEPDIVYLPAATLDGPVRDTTGAGDCFAGYFVAGLMEASVSASASSASASAAAASSASSAAAADASSTHSATHAAAAASAANTQPNTAADAREATVLALRRAVEVRPSRLSHRRSAVADVLACFRICVLSRVCVLRCVACRVLGAGCLWRILWGILWGIVCRVACCGALRAQRPRACACSAPARRRACPRARRSSGVSARNSLSAQ